MLPSFLSSLRLDLRDRREKGQEAYNGCCCSPPRFYIFPLSPTCLPLFRSRIHTNVKSGSFEAPQDRPTNVWVAQIERMNGLIVTSSFTIFISCCLHINQPTIHPSIHPFYFAPWDAEMSKGLVLCCVFCFSFSFLFL